ncbi:hypothetical protein BC936DRAFT_138366 [Jimgerdemannia flammicorona]|uniref:FAD/NAD(P)-binding domain-containing protein n=1 Tax=Jimgerdemannia flammicorona TaxID=994334 RepID=A0A433DIG8_9FUNG|nr:hypothetical protein BC936DRAFT_138366 [Jimgerdemannia flammicorona]
MEIFYNVTTWSARDMLHLELVKVLTDQSPSAVEFRELRVYRRGEPDQVFKEAGPIVLATGVYAVDFTQQSLLNKLDIGCGTCDGIKMSAAIGVNIIDLEVVQVRPTGLVDTKSRGPEGARRKGDVFAAKALDGVGGLSRKSVTSTATNSFTTTM